MKNIAFVSKRKLVAQGLEAALAARPELALRMLPLIPPQNARTDTCIYGPDIVIIDVTKDMERSSLRKLCRSLREDLPECRLLLLLSGDEVCCSNLSLEARQNGLVDDFVFYDSSMEYLLAKLTAL